MKKLIITAIFCLIASPAFATFSNTVVDIVSIGNGYLQEYGTFNCASVTTGTITADTTGNFTAGSAEIVSIERWGFASDGDNAVIPARDVANNKIKITCTSNDTGDYYIIGKAK